MLLVSSCAEIRASPPATAADNAPRAEPGEGTASLVPAVVALARGGFVDDPVKIEELLRLPGMAAALEWRSPPSWDRISGSRASFWASEDSPLRNLVLQRQVSSYGDGRRTNWLNVIFKNGRCPSLEIVEAALGMSFRVTMVPHHHGVFPPSPHRSLNFTASDGRDVYVAVDNDGCAIRLATPSRP